MATDNKTQTKEDVVRTTASQNKIKTNAHLKKRDDEVVCKKQKREASRIDRKKVCMTRKQWETQKYRSERAVSGRL